MRPRSRHCPPTRFYWNTTFAIDCWNWRENLRVRSLTLCHPSSVMEIFSFTYCVRRRRSGGLCLDAHDSRVPRQESGPRTGGIDSGAFPSGARAWRLPLIKSATFSRPLCELTRIMSSLFIPNCVIVCYFVLCHPVMSNHSGIIPVGLFSLKWAKSINQSSVDFHCKLSVDWLIDGKLTLAWLVYLDSYRSICFYGGGATVTQHDGMIQGMFPAWLICLFRFIRPHRPMPFGKSADLFARRRVSSDVSSFPCDFIFILLVKMEHVGVSFGVVQMSGTSWRRTLTALTTTLSTSSTPCWCRLTPDWSRRISPIVRSRRRWWSVARITSRVWSRCSGTCTNGPCWRKTPACRVRVIIFLAFVDHVIARWEVGNSFPFQFNSHLHSRKTLWKPPQFSFLNSLKKTQLISNSHSVGSKKALFLSTKKIFTTQSA